MSGASGGTVKGGEAMKRWHATIINEWFFENVVFDSASEAAAYIYRDYDDDVDRFRSIFDEELNHAGSVEIIGQTYPLAKILRAVDPTRYQTMFDDWILSKKEAVISDTAWELNRMELGETRKFNGYCVRLIDDEDEFEEEEL